MPDEIKTLYVKYMERKFKGLKSIFWQSSKALKNKELTLNSLQQLS